MIRLYRLILLIVLFVFSFAENLTAQSCTCGAVTTFTVNLTANPNNTYSVSTTRSGLCCGASSPDKCIRFIVYVHPQATEVGFDVSNPSPPGGAFYQVDCGTPTSLGTPLCLSGVDTFCLTYCKAGGDSPTYTISSSKGFGAGPDVTVRENCAGLLSVNGLSESSITWTSVFPGAPGTYNSYLSCLSACDTTYVTPTAGAPSFIDYKVCGTRTGCASGNYCDTIRVNTVSGMTVAITPPAPVICTPGPNATVTASATGGNAPYAYSWSTGATTSSISVGVGSYTVSVTDATLCPAVTQTVTVTSAPTPSAPTPGSNSPVCEGQTLSLTSNTIGGATYNWSGPNGFTSTLEDPTIASVTSAAAGTYSVYVVVAGCTSSTATTAVTINPIPAAPTAGSNSPVCSGQTLSLTANTIASATYSWTGPNSFSSTAEDPTIAGVTTAASGTYSVFVTVGGCAGPAGTTSVTINQTPAAPSASSNSPVCSGQTLSLSASTIASAAYSWNGPNSFTSALQNPTIGSVTTLASGTYSVTATVSGCTSAAGTTTVTINQTPSAPVAGSNSTVCSGQTLSLTASSTGTTYSWNGPNSFTSISQNPTIAGVTTAYAGTYSVTAIAAGCTSSVATTVVAINQTPSAPTPGSNTPVCSGQTLSLTSNTIASATYSWTGPNSFTSSLEDPTIAGVGTVNAGTYSVTATVAGCISSAGTTSVVINATPSAPVAGSNSPVCAGTTLSLTASTIASAAYSWSGPNSFTSAAQNPTIPAVTTAATGTYSVTATVTGCTGPAGTVSVTVNPIPASPTPGSNTPVCSGQTLSLTSNTIASATYNWTGPNSFTSTLEDPTIAAVTTAATGTYSVNVTVTGCTSSTATTSVTINATPSAPIPGSNTPVCAGQTLSLTSNTIASATYNWTGPNSFTSTLEDPTIAGATVAATGTYSVNVTVAGCTGPPGITTVTVNPSPAAPIPGSNSPICSGQTLSLTSNTIASAAYNWTGPNSFTSSLEDPTIAGATTAASGTYSVTATVSGCTSPAATIVVTVNPIPTVTPGSNSPACTGGDLSLTANTIAGATYSWSGPNSFTSASEDPVISGVTTAASGTYSVTATAAGCTSPVATTSVVVNAAAAAPTPGSNSPVCTGQTLSLTTSTVASGSYNWSGPNSFTSSLEDPTIGGVTVAAAGTYSLFVTVPGCAPSGTGTVSVTVNVTPAAPSLSSNSAICAGQNLSLSATGTGATYNWAGPNSFTSTVEDPVIAAATTAAAGTYTATTTSAAGCTSATGTTAVTINPSPVAPAAGSNSPICSATTLSLTASTIGGATYSWNGPNSFTSAAQNPTIPAATTAATGTYSVTATVAGCTGPAGTVSVTVTDPQTTTPGSNTPICSGQTLSLTATTVGGAAYSWTGPNSFTSTTEDPVIAGATTAAGGTYSVTITVAGCTGPATATSVTVNPLPAAPTAGSNSAVCEGSTLSLTASTIAGTTYSWSGPNSFTSTIQNPTIGSVTSAAAGTYSVVATYTATGCVGTAGTTSVIINPPPAPPTLSSNSPVCSGNTLSLGASSLVGASYSWSGPNSFTSASQNPTIPGVTTAATGTYSMTATVPGCPPLATVTISITINQTPAAPAAGSNSPICDGANLSLTASSTGSTYSWSGPNSFTSTTQNPVIAGATTAYAGTYSVTATSVDGCTGSAGTTTVTINTIPAALLPGNNSPICEGQTLSLTSNTIGGATYSWIGPNSFTSTLEDPTIAGATTADAGTYTVNATVSGCTGPNATTVVIINATPAAPVAGSNSSICSGQTLSLTASSTGTTYSWSGPLGYTSATQNPTIVSAVTSQSGTYSVTATTGGCTGPAGTTSVTVNQTPSITAGSNGPVCQGNTISLTSTTIAGATYSWNGPNSFSSTSQNPNIAGATTANSGTYTVNATSPEGCLSPNAMHTLTITPSIIVSAGADQTVCANNATTSLTGTVSGGTTTGIWTTSGSGGFVPGATSLSTNYIPSNPDTAAGTITLTLTSTSNGGCAAQSDALTLIITDAPIANAGADQTVCANNANVILSGSVNAAATGGSWATSGTGTFFPNNITLTATYIPSAGDTAAGTVTLTLTTTGVGSCSPVSDAMIITITDAPVVNAGATISVCSNNPNAALSGSSTTGSGIWTTIGTGTFTPSATALTATFVPSAGDIAGGSIDLILTSTANGLCNSEDDTVTVIFTAPPVVTAGSDQTVCANNNVVSVSGTSSTGTGLWTTSGSGTFASSSSLATTYTTSAADNSAGSVTLTLASTNNGGCLPVTDQLTVTITPAPTANAGPDQTVCANNAVATLSGSFTIATGGIWSSSGTGIFSSTISMSATYTPSPADTTAGFVNIILTTTGNGLCLAVTDTMTLTISNAPLVNAGLNSVACKNNPNFPLSGYSSTGSGIWTTLGTGTFTPTPAILTATYVPSSADTTAGSVTLILTSTGNGNCLAEDDSITIVYTPQPTVSAGSDVTVCANNATVTLSGTSSTGTGIWSTAGTGTFTPTASSLTASYIPSSADTAAGSVTLTLSSTNNGGCLPVTDQMTITITNAPTANAGPDQTVCANNTVVTLSGSFTTATGAIWSTSGTGTFTPDNLTMSADYIPSPADTIAGTVTLTLTTTGNGLCNAVTDVMVITITEKPIVSAGINSVACKNNPDFPLNGTSSTGSGIWTTMGTGTFTPTATTLNATYIPSTADTTAGSVILILTSTNNGNCTVEDDSITITYIDQPIVNAGANQTVCSNNSTITITGSSNTGSGQWSTLGTGTFANPLLLSTTYTPSPGDISGGNVTLVLASANNGTCLAVTDTMTVFFSPSPTANAGTDQTVCANNAVVTLSGSFTTSSGGGWTTLGTGTFSPDTATMTATYTPSAADTAAGSVTIVLTTTGNGNCLPVTDSMIITITDAPLVNAGIDQLVCLDNAVASLNDGSSSTGSGMWTTLGSGTFASPTSIVTTYTASAADTTAGSVLLVLTSTANGLCNAVTDTILLTFVVTPVVNAGVDQTVCANADTVSLSGTSTTGTGQWSSSGNGIFSPNDTSLITTYIPDSADTANGSVNIIFTSTGGCIPVNDTLLITITPSPEVNPGSDQIICAGTDTVFLSGSVTSGATTGQWSTSGTGIFVPNNTVMNPAYLISSADSASGSITIFLTSTNNGNCYAVTDAINILFVQPPIVNAGADITVCALPPVQLNGTVTGGSGTGVWSAIVGGGTFSPDSTVLNGFYYPSLSDTAYSTLTLVLTSTNNGNCPASTDTVNISISPPPGAFAGSDLTLCKNNADSVQLSGSVSYSGGGQWSTLGNGTFSPADTILNAYYLPDSIDLTQDTVILVLTTTGNGFCTPATDTLLLLLTPSPVVNAGNTILVCQGDSVAQLNGSVSGGATSGQWTTLGSGYFLPDDTTMNGTYILSPADTAAGGTTLVLTSTNNGNCVAETDTVLIVITPLPVVVTAGSDTIVCANNPGITLNGSVTIGASAGIWTTSGTGTFVPSDTSMNATYQQSAADTAAGSVILILTSTNGCVTISDSLVVTITDAPVVNAGADVSICEGSSVTLNGSVSSAATGGQWATSGNGTFSPNDSTLNATYLPGSNDTNSVTLVLTSTGNGQCLAVTDTLIIAYGSKPVAAFTIPNICTGSPVVFSDASTVQLPDTIASWNWAIDGNNFTAQNPSYTYTVGGSDTIILIVTSGIGCVDTAVQVVNVHPSPVASFSVMTSCSLDSVYFSSTSSISGGTIVSWSWNFGDTNTSSAQNPVHYYDSSGVYIVSLTVTSDSGCSSTITDTINSAKGIIAGFANNPDCQMNAAFTDTTFVGTGDSITSWQWDFGDGSPVNTSQNPSHTYAATGSYTVSLIVTSANGCSDTVTGIIYFAPFAVADFVPQSGTYNIGTTVAFTDFSTNAVSWYWNFGDGANSTQQNPSHEYTQNGTLDVTLVVMNSQGCPDTVMYTLIFNTNIVAVPSAFTPNGDNINDILKVKGGPLKEMNFRIYNEWGNELFRSEDQNIGWDGYYKNKVQPAARYVYILQGTTYLDEEINMQGDVTIIR